MENEAWNNLVKHIDKSKVFLKDLKQSNKNKQIAFLADATINDLNMIYALAKKVRDGQPVVDTGSGLHLADVKRSTSAFMLIAKTQPKVLNANVPVYWRKYVAEQDADLFGGKVVKCNITW